MRLITLMDIVTGDLKIEDERVINHFKEAIVSSNNRSQQTAIINSVLQSSKVNNEAKLKAKHRMLYNLLSRVSTADDLLLRCVYGDEIAAQIIQCCEQNIDIDDVYDNCCDNIVNFQDTQAFMLIRTNIRAKEAIFAIYERYGYRILSNILTASDKNVLYEFLSAFSEWTFNKESVDMQQIEAFAFRLTTF